MRSRSLPRNRRLLAMCGSHSALATGEPTSASQRPLNILFLLTDGQRWDTLGCMGNGVVQTPHIDRLAAQGMSPFRFLYQGS